jgi:hypothetical protein
MRVGVRQGMMPWGRERLAESAYEKAVEELAKPNPDRKRALWHLDCATNLNPKFAEAIELKAQLTGEEVTSVDNSSISRSCSGSCWPTGTARAEPASTRTTRRPAAARRPTAVPARAAASPRGKPVELAARPSPPRPRRTPAADRVGGREARGRPPTRGQAVAAVKPPRTETRRPDDPRRPAPSAATGRPGPAKPWKASEGREFEGFHCRARAHAPTGVTADQGHVTAEQPGERRPALGVCGRRTVYDSGSAHADELDRAGRRGRAALMVAGRVPSRRRRRPIKEKAEAQWNGARASVMVSLAQDQYKSGNFEKCRQTVDDALKLVPESPALRVLSPSWRSSRGSSSWPTASWPSPAKHAPDDAEALYLSGVVCQRWKKLPEAHDFYRAATEKAPTELAYLMAQSEMLVTMDRSDEALATAQAKVVYFEHSAGIRDAVARLMMQKGRTRRRSTCSARRRS